MKTIFRECGERWALNTQECVVINFDQCSEGKLQVTMRKKRGELLQIIMSDYFWESSI